MEVVIGIILGICTFCAVVLASIIVAMIFK